MTVEAFKDMLMCNEPDFEYNGQTYSISWFEGKYYVTASDHSKDEDLEFGSVNELLNNWMIQGKTLREILPFIDFDEVLLD